MRTDQPPRLTLVRGGVGVEESGSAFTTFGPARAGLITTHRTQSQALSELLNDLERKLESLEFRYLEACATLTTAMARLAELNLIKIETDTTDKL